MENVEMYRIPACCERLELQLEFSSDRECMFDAGNDSRLHSKLCLNYYEEFN